MIRINNNDGDKNDIAEVMQISFRKAGKIDLYTDEVRNKEKTAKDF